MTPTLCHFTSLSMTFDHQTLFSELTTSLSSGLTGLTGRNGCGKSVLMALLAGKLSASSGSIIWNAPIHYVSQHSMATEKRVADMLGVGEIYDCFRHIEQGQGTPENLAKVSDCWHLPAQWQKTLQTAGISASLGDPADQLSGGERSRLTLCAAFLQKERYLLLDEPDNHLDRHGREWLKTQLLNHPSGSLIVSHNRGLLRNMDRILLLNEHGIREYGGNYDVYRAINEAENLAAERQLENITRELNTAKKQQQIMQEKVARRRKQGIAFRESGSQSKLLLDAQTNRADKTQARLRQRSERQKEQLSADLLQQQRIVEQSKPQHLRIDENDLRGGISLYLNEVILPFGDRRPLSMTVRHGERWHIQGNNACGKSTLFRVIMGNVKPVSGQCRQHGKITYLDQFFSLLDLTLSPLDNLVAHHPAISETDWRTRLASLRMRGDKALQPLKTLSGGERLKVALLAATGGIQPPALLLLDEPDNHLDLESKQLLEATLNTYTGAIMIVSHDADFVQQIGVNRVLLLENA